MCRKHFLLTFLLLWHCAQGNNLLEEIQNRGELSKMAEIISKTDIVKIMLQRQAFTAFIPTNSAMDKYTGPTNEQLIEYHLIRDPFKIQEAKSPLTSFITGNPPLYLTKRPSGKRSTTGWEENDYFINNAKVIKANIKINLGHQLQFLHIIDEVLVPTIAFNRSGIPYPNARAVLRQPELYGFKGDLSLGLFRKRVEKLNLYEYFEKSGNHTFFLPVDEKINLLPGPEKNPIDKQVILGHIIPNNALFTRTSSDIKEPFRSMVDSNTLKVFIKMTKTTRPDSNEPVYYVESNTVKSDPKYMKGTAVGRIIKGNIPVKNGVLHIIDRPLMIIAGNIVEYLKQEHGIMSEFYNLIKEHLPSLMNQFSQDSFPVTVFAPSNSAFTRVNRERLERTISNREELRKILSLHLVPKRLTTEDMSINNGLTEQETMSTGRKLYFAVNKPNDLIPYVTVEGAGVNATITTPNVIAKNGVIHIIDRILGIPSQTVLDKLASDPTLSTSYSLISKTEWKDKLNDTSRKFTFFIPNNDAWDLVSKSDVSAYRKLSMGQEYSYHARQIMERHMIVNHAMSLDELARLTSNKTRRPEHQGERREHALRMARGEIYFVGTVKDVFGDYFVEWRGISAEIKRPDVECVNGVVHVINKVLMTAGDVTVNASNKMAGGVSTLASIIISVALAWSLI